MRLSDNELDPARLSGGAWWDWETKATVPGNVPHATHACFRVVPYVGSQFAVVFAEACQPFAELIRAKKMTAEQERGVWAEAAAKTLLRDWANLEHDDGSPIPFSMAMAVEILYERRWLLYAEFVEQAAKTARAALLREEEQAKGN